MNNKRAAKILLVIGLTIAGTGLYFGYKNIQSSSSFEQAEGIITGFHSHKNDDADHGWPNLTFVYKGDSIFSKIDYYHSGMEVGQTITVVFPPNDPKNAEIKSSLWALPLILIFFSLFFIIPSLLVILLDGKKSEKVEAADKLDEKKEPAMIKGIPQQKKGKESTLVGQLIITTVAGLLVWLVVFQLNEQLRDSGSPSMSWDGIIVVGIIALIFSLLSLVGWFGSVIELLSIDVDAEFVSVTNAERTVSEDGKVKYKWKLECKWNDPRTGRQVIFTSGPFEGEVVFYNRSKIKVSVLLQKPKAFYAVDMSFISTTDQTGIPLVDCTLLSQVEAAEVLFKEEEGKRKQFQKNKAYPPSLKKFEPMVDLLVKNNRLFEWGIRLAPVFLLLIVGLWWYVSEELETYRITSFEKSMMGKIGNRPWTFELNSGADVEVEINGEQLELPSGHWLFSGQTKSVQWVVDTHINPRVGKKVNYQGFTPSDEQRRLDVTHSTRWNSDEKYLADGEVLLVAEIPSTFPIELKEKLRTSVLVADSTSFMQDLVLEPDVGLLSVYFNELMQSDYSVLFEKKNMNRYVHEGKDNFYLIVTNNRKLADQLLTSYFLTDFDNWKTSTGGNVAILATQEKLLVVTLAPLTEPEQIETMVNFCVAVSEKLIRAKY
jgi:hypothetical protein